MKISSVRVEKEFNSIIRSGRKFASEIGYAKVVINSDNLPKIGFIIGKKISPSSVKRNRIKRRIREALRSYKQNIGLSFSAVIFPGTKALSCGHSEIIDFVDGLLKFAARIDKGTISGK